MPRFIFRIFIKIIAFCIIITIAFFIYLETYFSRYQTTPHWVFVAQKYIYTVVGVLRGDYEKVYAHSLYQFDPEPIQFTYITDLSPAERSRWFEFFLRSLQDTGQGEKIPEIMRLECAGYQNLLLDRLHLYSFVNNESKKENLHDVSQMLFETYDVLDTIFTQDVFLKEAWKKAKREETFGGNSIIKLNYRFKYLPSPWVYWWPSEVKWDISIVSENLTKTDKELRTIEEYHKLINYYLRCFYLLSHILVTESNLLAIERMWQMYHITNHSSWQRDAVICEKCANLLRRYYDTPLPIKQKASLLSTDIKVMK